MQKQTLIFGEKKHTRCPGILGTTLSHSSPVSERQWDLPTLPGFRGQLSPSPSPATPASPQTVATVCLERKYLLFSLPLPTTPPTRPLAKDRNSAGHEGRENRGTLSPAQRFPLSHLRSLLPAGDELKQHEAHPPVWGLPKGGLTTSHSSHFYLLS